MAHFISLITYTHQGSTQLGSTTKRAEAYEKRAEQLGVKIIGTFWTLGKYDIVHILEAENEKMAAALAMSTMALGNVRTHTLTAFTREEMTNDIIPNVQTAFDLLRVDP
jgi:uncharacterized protein with GYD domain